MVRLATLSPNEPVLRLPHPYLTPYYIIQSRKSDSETQLYAVTSNSPSTANKNPHEVLHNDNLAFTEPEDPKSSDRPHDSNNTAWGRARRAPVVTFFWNISKGHPTLGQLWLAIYIVFTIRPREEYFRLQLSGNDPEVLSSQLKSVSLAVDHPLGQDATITSKELLILRSTFWQGAGSPFGPRPLWVPDDQLATMTSPVSLYPLSPLDYVFTNDSSTALCWHPRRPAKPRPGSVIYSRWIPHLGENFSMVALDYQNDEHLLLFHEWQNDPRVSQGWNETGTLDHHREYLRKAHEDPHQVTVFARFDDVCFAYFEIYWAKEDRLGAYYDAHDFDRGRHSLVGDVRFRGPHRVSAWWSSLMHYLFLDDPRTMAVVGEPKYTNSTVLSYDFIHGFGLDKFVDLPHKRSGLMRCSRERFFQLCPVAENDKVVGGTGVGLLPKL